MRIKEVMLLLLLSVSVGLIGLTVIDGLVETGQASEVGGSSSETRPSNFVVSTRTPGPAPAGTEHHEHRRVLDEDEVQNFPTSTPTTVVPDFRDNTSDF